MAHVDVCLTQPPHPPVKTRIAAIVVTHNRLELLKECIAALHAQTRKPDEIIVVDNGSDDGTPEWLHQQTELTTIRQKNLGSSGGQHAGMDMAWQKGHDWFWCMDDDTVARPRALEALVQSPAFSRGGTGLLASVVRWTDGAIHVMNAPHLAAKATLLGRFRFDHVQAAKKLDAIIQAGHDHCVEIRTATFVSALINRKAVEEVGLPLKGMFIWGDDTEFTTRVNRRFKMYSVPASEVLHKTSANEGPPRRTIRADQRLKYLYGVRNAIITFRSQVAPMPIKVFITLAYLCLLALRTLRGQVPFTTLAWATRGLFFPIRADKPGATDTPCDQDLPIRSSP